MVEDEKFIDMCAVCKQGVTKTDMVYRKGLVFHSICFATHGSSFPTPDRELTSLNAKTRIELVQMKNLKVRTDLGLVKTANSTLPKKIKKKHAKKIKTKKKIATKKKLRSKKAKLSRKTKPKAKKAKRRR